MNNTLSELESKQLLSEAGIPIPAERGARSAGEAVQSADELGYPVVLKLCGRGIAHKSERNGVRLGLTDPDSVRRHAEELLALRTPSENEAHLLICGVIEGRRELIAGLLRDPVFGPCVMLGLGGIFAEVLDDVAFAVAPLGPFDADDLIDALACREMLGPFRGEPALDRQKLGHILHSLGRIGIERPDVRSIDINPLILAGSEPMVADALVVLERDAS